MKTTNKTNRILINIIVLCMAIFMSCSKDEGEMGPQGEKGEQGETGNTGSANVIYSDWISIHFDASGHPTIRDINR
jgi:hypothetical protein